MFVCRVMSAQLKMVAHASTECGYLKIKYDVNRLKYKRCYTLRM